MRICVLEKPADDTLVWSRIAKRYTFCHSPCRNGQRTAYNNRPINKWEYRDGEGAPGKQTEGKLV